MEDRYRQLLKEVELEMTRLQDQKATEVRLQGREEDYFLTDEDGSNLIFVNSKTCGFTDEELAITEKVLRCIGESNERKGVLMRHKRFAGLRNALKQLHGQKGGKLQSK